MTAAQLHDLLGFAALLAVLVFLGFIFWLISRGGGTSGGVGGGGSYE